ncbi:LysR family transcriptional regulator [Pseudomonas sp. HMWF032]|uniref:LysR family transcriptional regulator n=1 Tax=Pseudomonas sp. HMWF032 TaxID=2056866 RepID=UPI000D3772B1|nr:LysR family transcriptional regulator [Pseudomonas sp. HMWF032]PTS84314.1 LysR family transcriptional regulator [Pseudomonas sp. HMWF032]PTT82594.1 LysR family transcriptional regulator [Pseudomonas sp. HMWF010]
MHYDLVDLRLFVAIAEAKNLTRGAERVHLAASSASHRLRQLEASIGTPLLLREPRGVSLTRAGEALLRHARQVFAQLEQMHADLTPYAKGVRGHVSLWANTHATHTFLPDSLATFLQRHPQVSISLEEHTSPDVLMAVARGEVEVGVVAGAMEGADVELIPYKADRLVLIAPAEHPLAARKHCPFVQVLEYPFVMLHAGSAIHTFTMNAAAALGRHLEVRIQVRSFEAVCRMVAAGVGIGLVPRSAVSERGLPIIELEEHWAQRDLKVCVRKRALLSGFAAELVDCLTAEAD